MDLLGLASALFPNCVITMKSALFVHGLLVKDEKAPIDLCLAPFQTKVKDEQVRYWILPHRLFEIGSFYLDKGKESYLIYDLASVCAQYLHYYVNKMIDETYFLEGMSAMRKGIDEKEKARMREHLYLYPQARILMSLFDKYILS